MNKTEVARDNLALGSLIFFIIVLIRALIGPYWRFFMELAIAGVILIILNLFIKVNRNLF